MLLITLLIISLATLLALSLLRSREGLERIGYAFFGIQIALAGWAVACHGESMLSFFGFDTLGVSYLCMMALLGMLCYARSCRYLDGETLREFRLYTIALVALNIALWGVYLSNNITVTWIFLEATTIAAAGLIYHRRTMRSLEATWKYIFVSSVGIAVAYLGILLLSTLAIGSHNEVNLSYEWLGSAIAGGNPLYMKLGFIFILVGYSSKLEIFPLYTVGVDANHSAPTPASAFISSALVGGGFVAILRVYQVMQGSAELIGWVQNVLILVGVLSLLMAAVYIGRTRNFKRMAAYSTVENSGLVVLGMGIGGIGLWAAVLHAMTHTLIKGSLMLQLSVVGKVYGSYITSRHGGYFRLDPLGALVLLLSAVALIAMPPSLLFRTEYMMFTSMIHERHWAIFAITALLLLAIIYWLCSKMLPLLFKPEGYRRTHPEQCSPALSSALLLIILFTFAMGIWQCRWIISLIDSIVS